MSSNNKIAVVLLNLGGPDSLEAVEPFLYNLFSDPDIINFPLSFLFRKKLAKLISSKRAPKIQKQYNRIGGKSPILDITKKQAEMLEERLNKTINAKVFIAMRYWKPFTSDTVELIEKENFDKIILLPLYPQYSIATTGSSINEWNRVIRSKTAFQN
jgi:ferrochelatase